MEELEEGSATEPEGARLMSCAEGCRDGAFCENSCVLGPSVSLSVERECEDCELMREEARSVAGAGFGGS